MFTLVPVGGAKAAQDALRLRPLNQEKKKKKWQLRSFRASRGLVLI